GASADARGHGQRRPSGNALQVRFRRYQGAVRMSLPMVVLAGGLATRLRPMTERVPKLLVDVGGQPFAVHQIALLRRHGVTDITFLVGHMGEMIRATLGNGSQ